MNIATNKVSPGLQEGGGVMTENGVSEMPPVVSEKNAVNILKEKSRYKDATGGGMGTGR